MAVMTSTCDNRQSIRRALIVQRFVHQSAQGLPTIADRFANAV
jgi:hypothetical protein